MFVSFVQAKAGFAHSEADLPHATHDRTQPTLVRNMTSEPTLLIGTDSTDAMCSRYTSTLTVPSYPVCRTYSMHDACDVGGMGSFGWYIFATAYADITSAGTLIMHNVPRMRN